MTRAGYAALAALGFLVLATANSGGYRYGVSDQAYYLPAIERHLDPALFPRDGALLDAQSRLMTVDELMAAVVTTTRAPLPTVAITFYVVSLLVCFAGAVAFARGLRFGWWTVAAFTLLLTLRHRITKTGANSLEGYMHPRLLAFGLGISALACLVRDHTRWAVGLLAVAALLHPTTALWFGLLALAAMMARTQSARRVAAVVLSGLALAALWMVTIGPLSDRLVVMNASWLSVLAEKDYLFPSDWAATTWLINLAYTVVIVATWRQREREGLSVPAEAGLAWGAVALTVIFLCSVPLSASALALAVQLQVSRVFWVLDFLALASVAWWLTRRPTMTLVAVAVLAVASAGRGYYLLEHDQPERTLVTVNLPDTEWTDAMTWIRQQPSTWHVLADPGHAWKYGSSVRMSAARDTVLESVKDSALSLYDPAIAARVAQRVVDLADYDRLTTRQVHALDEKYALDVVVTEQPHHLDLPVLYRNSRFVVYDLR